MANYCGKNCNECTYKEQLNCPGCAQGPGNVWTGDCKLAKCCDDKGHDNCESCGHKSRCGLLSSKHTIPKERISKLKAKEAEYERIAKITPTLSKYLPILFWTTIVAQIAGFFTADTLESVFPPLFYSATAVNFLCAMLYGIILFLMSSTSTWYKTAGLLYITGPLVSLVSLVLIILTRHPALILLSIASLIITLFGQYNEFKGHEEVLFDVDPDLSDKWKNLWKWNLYTYIAVIASLILAIMLPVIGAIIALVSSIAAIVLAILKIYYLYKTAETFKIFKNTIAE